MLEAAARHEQGLATDDRAVRLVHRRRHDQVELAVLVLEQHEDDAVGRRGALARDDHARHRDVGAVWPLGQLLGREDVGVEVRAQQLQRVQPDRQRGGAVVGEHPLPVGELLESRRRRGGRVEGEGELAVEAAVLRAPGAAAARCQAELPEQLAAQAVGVTGAGPDERLQHRPLDRRALRQVGERGVRPAALALGRDRLGLGPAHGADVAKADAHRPRRCRLDRALGQAAIDLGRAHLHPAPLRVTHEARRRVEAHRLGVEQRAEEDGRVVVAQPGRLVGEQPERGGVRLGEAEAGEGDELVVDQVGGGLVHPARGGARLEAHPIGLERIAAALAAHRASQALRLADGEAGHRHRHVQHLILEDHDSERLAQRLGEQRVVDGSDEVRIELARLAVLDVGVDGLALDRAGAHEGDLHGEIVEVLRLGLQDALHLRAALDLEDADRVGRLDVGVDGRVVERDAREVDRGALQPRELIDAVLDGAQHAQAEQVDLEEAGVAAGVLVPLADLAAGHRGGLHGDELDERPAGDDHAARVLRDVARQPGDLVGQRAEGAPAARGQLLPGVGQAREVVGDRLGRPAVGDAGEPFQVGVRQAERLADVADGAACPVGREGGDERGVLAAVALGDGDDQRGADVPREVKVDVGNRRQLAVEEAAEREVRPHRIDVREPGEVADDRADRGAAAPARRQRAARRVAAAHAHGDLARQLQHLPVQQEEAGEPELGDQRQLLLQASPGLALVAVGVRVAAGELALGELAQLDVRAVHAAGEVGVAVAELLRQVEGEALGQLAGAVDGSVVAREALEHLGGGQQDALPVAAALLLGALQRGAVAQRHQDVLQRRAAAHVAVHVAGDDGLDAERLGQVAQGGVTARVPALVGALQLDVEAVAPERGSHASGCLGVA